MRRSAVRMIFLDRFDETGVPTPAADALRALQATHNALAGFDRSELPSFLDAMRKAGEVFATESLSPTLPGTERRFCLNIAAQLTCISAGCLIGDLAQRREIPLARTGGMPPRSR